ncbi:MAG TPA: hypothetical protein VL426_03790 [Candidatus Binatia bacterium]|nr:hypothetical protein [Candidatus Binatia bacterium]
MTQEQGPGLVRLGSQKVFIATCAACEGRAGAGAVVIPRRDARPNVYATVYEALRSRMEIMRRYGVRGRGVSELERLASVRDDLRETHVSLLAGETGRADGSFASAAEELKRKRNVHKAEARKKAEAGVVRHPTSTVNRGATRARLTAIDRRLALREDEVRSIAPWIGAMETALLLEVRRCESIVRDLDRAATAMRSHELVRKGETSERQRRAIAARLRVLAEPLATLAVEPFLSVRNALCAPVLRAVVSAENGTGDEFAAAVGDIVRLTGASVARSAIESTLVLMAAGLPPGQLAKAAERSARAASRSLSGCGAVQTAALVAAALRLAVQCLREGHPDAAKPRLKEAIAHLDPA